MFWLSLCAVGVLSVVAWSILEFRWLQELRKSNGTRPFISTISQIGHVFFLEAVSFVILPLVYQDTLAPAWMRWLLMADRFVSLIISNILWRLHKRLEVLVEKTHYSGE